MLKHISKHSVLQPALFTQSLQWQGTREASREDAQNPDEHTSCDSNTLGIYCGADMLGGWLLVTSKLILRQGNAFLAPTVKKCQHSPLTYIKCLKPFQ